MKRLKDTEQGPARFFERVDALEDKLGPVVFQLPGRFKPDRARLAGFLAALPARHRYAFEFRDPAWFEPEVLDLLKEHDVALCLYEFAGREAPLEVTADFVYIRLHGPEGPTRAPTATRRYGPGPSASRAWTSKGRDVYCYFDNDQAAMRRRTPCD